MKLSASIVIVLACILLSACSESISVPAIDDPRVIKHVFDLAGGASGSGEFPQTILAVESTLAEIDEFDEKGSYGPNNPDLHDPVYYFVFSASFMPDGPGPGGAILSGPWTTVILASETGKLRQMTNGSSYLNHPGLAQISVPDNLSSIDVDPTKLFPEWGRKFPPVTPAPPATSAPSAP